MYIYKMQPFIWLNCYAVTCFFKGGLTKVLNLMLGFLHIPAKSDTQLQFAVHCA